MTRAWVTRHRELLLLCAVMVPVAWIRFRLADIPLGRDEGEYAYAGQLLLHGVPPYVQAYNMKFPGSYYAYSVILAILGQTPRAIRVGLLFLNFSTAFVLFAVGRRVTDRLTATLSATVFLVLSLDRWVQGTFAHATHFALLPGLAGILVLHRAYDGRRVSRLLGAGALFAVATLMKQHAALLTIFGLWFIWRYAESRRAMFRDAGWFVLGALIPFAALSLMFAIQGVLGKFFFWTFHYGFEYIRIVPLSDGWTTLVRGFQDITRATLLFWLLSASGLVLLWITRWPRPSREYLTIFGVVSFLTVCPGLYFRSHYFILALPAAALLAGVALTSLGRQAERVLSRPMAAVLAVAMIGVVTSVYVVREWRYLFVLDGPSVSREIYGMNPFVEAPEIARYIRERTEPGDPIAVIGSEPEIYFLADRPSATGYIYTYPLMEPQPYASGMQDEMMTEIETAHPKYIVAVLVSSSWSGRPSSDHRILNWAQRYTADCYDEVGIADILPNQTTMRWDAEAPVYEPRSPFQVQTFKRKSPAPCTASR